MELGLTLGGGGGSAFAGVASSTPFKNSTDLGLALGVSSGERHRRHHEGHDDRTVTVDSPRLRLDLFTGSSEGGSPDPALKAFNMNRVAVAAALEAEAVSSPNSVASDFQAGFGPFPGGEQLGERTTSSRASDEDENGSNRKKLRLSKEQAAFLEERFNQHNTLNTKQKQALANQLNLRPRQVEVWFQNRRARTKLKQTEVDCEYLKRCAETLTVENRRLQKELQELRALKSSNPYYMQQPATTLTMCPSCERTTTTTTTPATSSAAAATAAFSNNTGNPSSKSAPFPLSRPKFFPFSSHNNQPQRYAAS